MRGRQTACPCRAQQLVLREHEISVITVARVLIQVRLRERLGTHRWNLVGHQFLEARLLSVHQLFDKGLCDTAHLAFRGFDHGQGIAFAASALSCALKFSAAIMHR